MLFHILPTFTTVEFHPVVVAILDVSYVFESLSEQVPEIVVIGRIFEAQVTNVAEIFVEFFCDCIQYQQQHRASVLVRTYLDTRRTDL